MMPEILFYFELYMQHTFVTRREYLSDKVSCKDWNYLNIHSNFHLALSQAVEHAKLGQFFSSSMRNEIFCN